MYNRDCRLISNDGNDNDKINKEHLRTVKMY